MLALRKYRLIIIKIMKIRNQLKQIILNKILIFKIIQKMKTIKNTHLECLIIKINLSQLVRKIKFQKIIVIQWILKKKKKFINLKKIIIHKINLAQKTKLKSQKNKNYLQELQLIKMVRMFRIANQLYNKNHKKKIHLNQ